MHPPDIDQTADAADTRHRDLINIEITARHWTGTIRCETCNRTIDQAAVRHCTCRSPHVRTIDQVVAAQTRRLQAADDRILDLTGQVAEARAIASEAEAMARLARQHAADLEGVLARQRAELAEFVSTAAGILGGAHL